MFRGEYHDQDGGARVVHWCGPKGRVGSGLTVPVPVGPWSRVSPGPAVWEARMTKCTLDAKLGNITQHIQAVTDLNFNVEISGGPLGAALSVGDLENNILYGRWTNNKCSLWLIDLDTLDTQQIAFGYFDKNPTAITSGVFAVTMVVAPFIPSLKMPGTLIPHASQIPSLWTNTSNSAAGGGLSPGSQFVPADYKLNPAHEGKFLGCTFGTSQHSLSGQLDDGFIWKELVPFGSRGFAASGSIAGGQMAFAHVDAHTNCYVHEVWIQLLWEDPAGDVQPGLRSFQFLDNTQASPLPGSILTYENLDPTRGPTGTNVRLPRLSEGSIIGSIFGFTGGARCIAKVSGPGSGISTGQNTDSTGYVEKIYDDYSGAQNVRPNPWQILEDLFDDPQYLGPLDRAMWATDAMNRFFAARPEPHAQNAYAYFQMAGSVPSEPNICEELPSVREGIQGIASSFPFDIVHRWDHVTQELRMAPIWRSTFSQEPDHIITEKDLQRTDPPEISQYDNKSGKYANQVNVQTPDSLGAPRAIPLPPPTDVDDPALLGDRFEQVNSLHSIMSDVVEQGPEKQAAIVHSKRTWKHWLHSGVLGNLMASWFLGIELSQPQRTVRAVHGVRSFMIDMGESIKYKIRGVNKDNGQVRSMRYDFDRQTVAIESLHIDHYERSVPPRGATETWQRAPKEPEEESEE